MSLAPIVHELRLACTVQVAFATYVERIGAWWPPASSAVGGESFSGLVLEPALGGRMLASYGAEQHEWGRVTVWEPVMHLAHTFTHDLPPGDGSLVRLDLCPYGHGTAVRFEHGGWAPGTEPVRSRFTGWPRALGRYAFLAEHPLPGK